MEVPRVPSERKLDASAQSAIGAEPVLATGLFQPYGHGDAD